MRRLRDGVILKLDSVQSAPRRRRAHSCSPISNAGVLNSQAEIASFMEATLPQDKGETLPASPILDFEKGPEGLLYKDDVVEGVAPPRRARPAARRAATGPRDNPQWNRAQERCLSEALPGRAQ